MSIACTCGNTGGCDRCRPTGDADFVQSPVFMTHFVGDDCPGGHAEEAQVAFKFDGEKIRYDLVPPYPLSELAKVYTDGARKYGDFNYRKGMSWRRVVAALIRHVEAWRSGESVDPESGSPHLAHAAWQCFALMEYEKFDLGQDDRIPQEETDG